MSYGIIIYMYREKNGKHNLPHIHAKYNDEEVVITFDGTILEGKMKSGKLKLLFAWIEIHKDELNANWTLLQDGQPFFKINPLV